MTNNEILSRLERRRKDSPAISSSEASCDPADILLRLYRKTRNPYHFDLLRRRLESWPGTD